MICGPKVTEYLPALPEEHDEAWHAEHDITCTLQIELPPLVVAPTGE